MSPTSMDATEAPHRERPLALAIGGLIAMAAAVGIGRFIYTPILPGMIADGMTPGEAGLVASANFLGYLAGALLAATRLFAGSPRGWLLACLATSATTTAIMGIVDGLAAWLALRLVGGAASAVVLVFASALVLERLGAVGRSGLSAIHFAGVGAGIAISAAIAAAALAADLGWRSMWLAGGGVSFAALLAVLALVPEAPRTEAGTAPAALRITQRLATLTLAYGLFGFGYVITATFIVTIVRATSAAPSVEPLVWLAVGLGAIPSVALWTLIGRRFGILEAFAAASLIEAAGVAASVLWAGAAGALVSAFLLGATFMGITALGLIAAREMADGAGRQAVAMLTAAFGLGQIVGPLIAGFGREATGSFLAPSLVAALALLAAAALAWRIRRTKG
ncbi:MAG: YbfB/YjiJ family MFS transporter [Hyphomicrobiaceae bacterium]